ncbi:MAG: hypothetical protein ACRD1R_16255 [Acidobacteriota bacterium]
MRNFCLQLLILTAAGLLFADLSVIRGKSRQQADTDSEPLYRIVVALHVLEGEQRTQTLTYIFILEEGDTGKSRVLTKVPIVAQNEEGFDDDDYVEAGVKCDLKYEENRGLIFMDFEMQYTEIVPSGQTLQAARAEPPVLREMQCGMEATLVPGAATIIGEFDDPEGIRRYQVEVTAEKLR